jgi:PIN domain nuclease of toxin-antitoxin system
MSKKDTNELLLLDTHVWIWLINGDEKLKSSDAITYIARTVQFSNIRVSAISVWEVGMLEAKGRISFSMDCLDWVRQALAAPGISLAPLTPEIAIASSRLPGTFHGHPADRIIVATTRELGASLVTKDRQILEYSQFNHLNVMKI